LGGESSQLTADFSPIVDSWLASQASEASQKSAPPRPRGARWRRPRRARRRRVRRIPLNAPPEAKKYVIYLASYCTQKVWRNGQV